MSDQPDATGELDNQARRSLLRAGGGIAVGGIAVVLGAGAAHADDPPAGTRDPKSLGARLRGVQHFGLTVQNMDRAYEFIPRCSAELRSCATAISRARAFTTRC